MIDKTKQPKDKNTIPTGSRKERLIAEIIQLGVHTHYRTERCVFVEFHGHIDGLTVSVRESMNVYQNEIASTSIMLTPYSFFDEDQRETFEQELIDTLEETKVYLETFLRTGEINPDSFVQLTTRAG